MAEPRHAATAAEDALAAAAVAEIEPGMVVGLGAGKTAARALAALARRAREEAMDVLCVASSKAVEREALDLGLRVEGFGDREQLDLLFDGADEVDGHLRMMKGQHGAIVAQRIMAHAAARRIYLVNELKLVSRLGTRSTLPICVLEFGVSWIRSELRAVGLSGVIRRDLEGRVFHTDNGHLVLDVSLGEQHKPEELTEWLDRAVGVIEHGLFLTEADEVLVETSGGRVKRLTRETVV